MKDSDNGKRNGYIAAAVAVLAVVGGIYSMVQSQVQPQRQSIEFMERQHADLVRRIEALDQREREAERSLSAIRVQFVEVETQFDAAEALNIQRFLAVEANVSRMDAVGNPRHDERIKNLEEMIRNP